MHNPSEEKIPLKIWNKYKEAGIIAVFNINANGEEVEGTVSPSDIPEITGERFVVYSHINKKAVAVDKSQKLNFRLKDNEVDIYIIKIP